MHPEVEWAFEGDLVKSMEIKESGK
jgi:hypothetical protein